MTSIRRTEEKQGAVSPRISSRVYEYRETHLQTLVESHAGHQHHLPVTEACNASHRV